MSRKLQDQLFNLKFTAKQLGRNSKKALKNEKAMKKKLKKAIEQGNTDGARIYAQNAIREKNQALNMLRLQSRVEAVAARVQTAVDMNSVSKAMGGVVKGMNKALTGGAMDVDKLTQIMDQFEKNSDDLEVRTAYMEGTMSSSTATSTPEDEVDGLIKMVADEHGLQLMDDFNGAGVVGTKTVEDDKKKEASNEVDDLAARLAALHR
jgi:charged multivesicular body protein 1